LPRLFSVDLGSWELCRAGDKPGTGRGSGSSAWGSSCCSLPKPRRALGVSQGSAGRRGSPGIRLLWAPGQAKPSAAPARGRQSHGRPSWCWKGI